MATTKEFDVIVVGTGAGGGTAMKLLCEAGLKVCALNSGPRTDPSKDYRLHRQPFDLKFRGYGDPLRFQGQAHQEPYTVEESEYSEGRDLFEHDIAYSTAPGTDWYWKRCKATGGKANFWGRSSARFGDIDFKAADRDGFGENWPVDYAEISPWFAKAERYMGVASTIQNRPSNPDGEYLPPMPWRCIDYIIQKGAEKIGVPYLPDRCAQLTKAHNGHPACHYCGNCSRGCDVGSFFSPTWFTIPEAEATKNLTLLTNALVRAVIVDENGMARGVAYVDRATKREIEIYAKVVVLAASCVETAHIMLNSKSRHWPAGIANSSGQVGRNLCDHLYGCPGYGYIPRLLGQPATPDNIADSTVAWMPRWQNLKNPREEKFIRGYSVYMTGGVRRISGSLFAAGRVWRGIQEGDQGLLSRDDWVLHSGAVFAESDELCRYRSGEKGYLWDSAAAISLSVGRERAADVGTLQTDDERSVQGDGWGDVGSRYGAKSAGE